MKLLLDTHIIIWSVSSPKLLSENAKRFISDAKSIFVSAASIWEICIKMQLNKIQLDLPLLIHEIKELGVQSLPITWEHAHLTKELPPYHRDPFDRILVAQAMSEPLTLLTHDKTLSQYTELVRQVDSL